MQTQATTAASTCSSCGESLASTGVCAVCLLRVALEETPGDLEKSFVFGEFEIVRRDDGTAWELGRGAMGVTYRAVDRVLDRAVALKVIEAPATAGAYASTRERFLREARAAALLRHENVASVFQFGALPDSSRCYCAMELIEGETLEARVRSEGALPVELCLEIAAQVTHALIAAADRGMIHRDLKPGNIMLAPNENRTAGVEVKVIDFGLARLATEARDGPWLRGGFSGTPVFASPEQFAGSAIDSRSDLYSLGATLWFVLTGAAPFSGQSMTAVKEDRRSGSLDFENLSARQHIPRSVIGLLRRMLATDPADRPQMPRELLAAIEHCRHQLAATKQRPRRVASLILVSLLVLLAIFGLTRIRPKTVTGISVNEPPKKSIAVLPFANLNGDKEDYFANGIQDEILSDLARIADLRVISRTSVMQYASGQPRDVQTIGKALDVANILEGSVQRIGNHVRIAAQLIDARTDSHIWSETYQRDLSDAFAIEDDVAEQIASQLEAKISPEERAVIQEKPTSDLTAYTLYSQAMSGRCTENMAPKIKLLEQAIERDPNFILAYCALAFLYDLEVTGREADRVTGAEQIAAKADAVVDKAVRLRPDRGEPHLAKAYHLFFMRRFAQVRPELEIALRLLPNDSTAIFLSARVDRHENRWEDALVKARRAYSLDPHDVGLINWLAEDYIVLRRYRDAKEFLREATAKNPALVPDLNGCLARCLVAEGDFAAARKVPVNLHEAQGFTAQFQARFFARDYEGALKFLATAPQDAVADCLMLRSPRSLGEAVVYRAMGQRARSDEIYRVCRQALDANPSVQAKNEWYYSAAAGLDAALARKGLAIEEAHRAMDLRPIATDPINGTQITLQLAVVYAHTGERALALDQLEVLAKMHTSITYGELRYSPDWDPLRGDPRFDKILAAFSPK